MDLTVNQLLGIVGRLDDSPGFDTPRERFRRFLTERVANHTSARLVIADIRQVGGEQHARALLDAVVLTGTLLGFEVTFGRYQREGASTPFSGEWQSRRRLRVSLIVCGARTDVSELDLLADALRNDAGPEAGSGVPRIALCVLTPMCAARARVEERVRTHEADAIRLISIEGILHLADLVAGGRLTHEDVLRVLNPTGSLDAMVDVIDRSPASTVAVTRAADGIQRPEEIADREYWVAAIQLPRDMPKAQFVDAVIAKRRLLAVNPAVQLPRAVRAGDGVCVSIADAGFVAHGRVEGIVTDGSTLVRNAERFAQVLKLTDVTVYDAPLAAKPELVPRLDRSLNGDQHAVIAPISRQDFELVVRAGAASRN
jgi:hypothetical protein